MVTIRDAVKFIRDLDNEYEGQILVFDGIEYFKFGGIYYKINGIRRVEKLPENSLVLALK